MNVWIIMGSCSWLFTKLLKDLAALKSLLGHHEDIRQSLVSFRHCMHGCKVDVLHPSSHQWCAEIVAALWHLQNDFFNGEVQGTVEERMQQVQARKQRMVAGALNNQEVRSARIEELKMLFRWFFYKMPIHVHSQLWFRLFLVCLNWVR